MQDKLQMLQTVMCTVGQIFFLKKKKIQTHTFLTCLLIYSFRTTRSKSLFRYNSCKAPLVDFKNMFMKMENNIS